MRRVVSRQHDAIKGETPACSSHPDAAHTAALTASVADNGASYTVTLDGTTSITFQKGMASSGGSIDLGGVVTPLRADVQRRSVTADGPAWEP